jgi:hypothetical protein
LPDQSPPGAAASLWIDIDSTIAGSARSDTGDQVGIDEVVNRHIKAIETWIAALESQIENLE